MADPRWSAINELVADALEHPPAERKAFIDRACGPDLSLRAAAESLLEHATSTDGLMAQPVFALNAALEHLTDRGSWDDAPREVLPAIRNPRHDRRGAFFWFAIAFGTIFLVLFFPAAVWKVARSGNTVGDFGWTAQRSGGIWRVKEVNPSGPAATILRTNDEIVAFDGDPRARDVGTAPYRRFVPVGATYTLRIGREFEGERQSSIALPLVTRPGTALLSITYVVLSLCFCLMALVMGLSKPQDAVARLGCLAGCLAGLRLLGFGLVPYVGVGRGAAMSLDQLAWLCEPLSLALSYHFLYRFSFPTSRERLWSAINVAIYAACSMMFVLSFPLRLAILVGRETSISIRDDHPLFVSFSEVFVGSVSSIALQIFVSSWICAVILHGYHQAKDADQRRRIRWVVFGCLCAFVPLVFLRSGELLLRAIGAAEILGGGAWRVLDYIADLSFIAVPVSFAYAVVKYRVLGVSVVMRRSIQYLLARRVLQAFLLLPVAGLLLPLVRNPNRPVSELFLVDGVYLNLLLLVALCLSLRYRHQLRLWLDRRYFREAHDRETLLRDSLGRIKDVASVNDVARLVGDTLSATLHPSFICVLSRVSAGAPFAVSYLSRAAPATIAAVVEASTARVRGRGSKLPFNVTIPADSSEEFFAEALVVPIVNSDAAPIGLIILGEKQSDEPYHIADRDLLRGIAEQVALVQETRWLRQQVEEQEVLRRNVLAHLSPSITLAWECKKCGRCFDFDLRRCPHDGGTVTLRVPVERVIANRYRLERRLGEGGMGAVYQATDLQSGKTVAVKLTREGLFRDPDALLRFGREWDAIRRLHHPHIVEVYDFARIAPIIDNEDYYGAYLVMELVLGSTWRKELKDRGALPLLTIACWVDQLLEGLEAAHDAGVVHRDLKPENVLITEDGEHIKIADFGLAALVARDVQMQKLTISGAVMGTLGYMSPEQMRGEPCDERSDLFSAAIIAAEAVTGTNPWTLRDYDLTAADRLELRLGSGTPGGDALTVVLRKCLASQASLRYQTAREMREPLVAALRDCALAHGESVVRSKSRPFIDAPFR